MLSSNIYSRVRCVCVCVLAANEAESYVWIETKWKQTDTSTLTAMNGKIVTNGAADTSNQLQTQPSSVFL